MIARLCSISAMLIVAAAPGTSHAAPRSPNGPDCSGPDHYPAAAAFSVMKNEGLLTNESVRWKQVQSRTIASQRIGKNLWRQIFRVTYPLTTGRKIEAIVVEEVSFDECSMSNPQIFLVSKAL